MDSVGCLTIISVFSMKPCEKADMAITGHRSPTTPCILSSFVLKNVSPPVSISSGLWDFRAYLDVSSCILNSLGANLISKSRRWCQIVFHAFKCFGYYCSFTIYIADMLFTQRHTLYIWVTDIIHRAASERSPQENIKTHTFCIVKLASSALDFLGRNFLQEISISK